VSDSNSPGKSIPRPKPPLPAGGGRGRAGGRVGRRRRGAGRDRFVEEICQVLFLGVDGVDGRFHGHEFVLQTDFILGNPVIGVKPYFCTLLGLRSGIAGGRLPVVPRQMRIEYPGAIYHVLSRGDRREAVFLDDGDCHDFLKTLAEACQKTGFQIHAYCLMRNHFHLVVETPQGNLVAGMRWLLSTPLKAGQNRSGQGGAGRPVAAGDDDDHWADSAEAAHGNAKHLERETSREERRG
jgi:REP element-mobilizing transposase RayT